MKKTKIKVVVAVLLASVLLAGTTTALAGGTYAKLEDVSVAGETYASSTFSGMARTVSSSHEAETGVDATYRYHNSKTNDVFELQKSDEGYYGSEVTFSLPKGYDYASIIYAYHTVYYKVQGWETFTVAYFDY